MSEIRELIEHIAKGVIPVQVIAGTVESVDKGKGTCKVKPFDGPVLHKVRLRARIKDNDPGGVTMYPEVGSDVLVGVIMNKEETTYVALMTEIESVRIDVQGKFKATVDANGKVDMEFEELIMRGGQLGGLIKIQEAVNKYNQLENKVNSLVSKFNSHTHLYNPGPSAPAPSAPPATPETPIAPITQVTDLENDKIKHG